MNRQDRLDEQFVGFAEEAIRKAEKVDCSQKEYLEGLKAMVETLSEQVFMVKDEIGEED